MLIHGTMCAIALCISPIIASNLYMDYNITWNLSAHSDGLATLDNMHKTFGPTFYQWNDAYMIVPAFRVNWTPTRGLPTDIMPTTLSDIWHLANPINLAKYEQALTDLVALPWTAYVMSPGKQPSHTTECPWCLDFEPVLDGQAFWVRYSGMRIALMAHVCLEQSESYRKR